ncbi:hypothetical protein N7488_008177 [Penicillium malachiteum]|nr:hypothetical protein N7488_008177 [Penicillium malachiteum]
MSAMTGRSEIRLHRVYPTSENPDIETDIDIIAIHGLDTKSPETWQFKNVKENIVLCNWLKDKEMLPSKVGTARIFTIDWPAEMFERRHMEPKGPIELARLLISGVEQRLKPGERNQDRPIYFIASCLGGLMLIKALVIDEGMQTLQCTRGITFLATPFSGTALSERESLARPSLSFMASKKRKNVNPLYTEFLGKLNGLRLELVDQFLRHRNKYKFHVITFYEGTYTSLSAKALAKPLSKIYPMNKILVDRESATLFGLDSQILINKDHLMMNKFEGPSCAEYKLVVGKIERHLSEIRHGTLVMKMAKALQNHYMKPGRLEIQRLSRQSLPMESYYINLLLVKEIREEGNFTNEDRNAQLSSSFSLPNRLGVQTVDEDVRVDIKTLFERRSGRREAATRVLIRGRAGVGKTTLCKKIVYDFFHSKLWRIRFDYIFWIPLRSLKSLHKDVKNATQLLRWQVFRHESEEGDAMAEEAWQKLKPEDSRAVFLLDGLDEISDQLNQEGRIYKILEDIMEVPYVIVTSRPHVSLPECMRREGQFHLELETLGFDSPQVEEYIKGYYVGSKFEKEHQDTPEQILNYLKKYPLIQSLMQIPVQLDALCFTWNDFKNGSEPQTMTDLYNNIEIRLWTDYLERVKGKEQIMNRARKHEIDFYASADRSKIEFLAFSGMHSNVIEFERRHLDKIFDSRIIKIDPDKIFDQLLGELSFFRSSGGSAYADSEQSYHFIHLTYQEYFAARYFARQWELNENVECSDLNSSVSQSVHPSCFLKSYKYESRYGIFWRFVAGLLDSNPQPEINLARLGKGSDIARLFTTIDEKPLDLLSSSHQRLIMCCLSEVKSESFPFRKELEHNLSNWLLFDCKVLLSDPSAQSPISNKHLLRTRYRHRRALTLASEDEFPDGALYGFLKESDEIKAIIFTSLKRRVQIPPEITDKAISILERTKSENLAMSILRMFRHIDLPATSLPNIYKKLDSLIESEARAAQEAMDTKLPWPFLLDKIADAKSRDRSLNAYQCSVIGNRPIPEKIMNDLVEMLKSDHASVGSNASEILARHRSNFSETVLNTIWLQIQQYGDHHVKQMRRTLHALSGQSELPSKFIKLLLNLCREGGYKYSGQAFALLFSLLEPPDEDLSQFLARKAHGTVQAKWLGTTKGSRAWCKLELSETTVTNLVIALDTDADGMSLARHLILIQMAQRQNVEGSILRSILNGRNRYDSEGRKLAIRVLNHQMKLSNQILIVNQILDSPERGGILEALSIFKHYPHLLVNELERISAYLNHEKLSIRTATLDTLGVQSNLTRELINKICHFIGDSNPQIAGAAMQTIINCPSIKSPSILEEVLIKISKRMQHSE